MKFSSKLILGLIIAFSIQSFAAEETIKCSYDWRDLAIEQEGKLAVAIEINGSSASITVNGKQETVSVVKTEETRDGNGRDFFLGVLYASGWDQDISQKAYTWGHVARVALELADHFKVFTMGEYDNAKHAYPGIVVEAYYKDTFLGRAAYAGKIGNIVGVGLCQFERQRWE